MLSWKNIWLIFNDSFFWNDHIALPFILLMWSVVFIHVQGLNCPCLPEINPKPSWWLMFFRCHWLSCSGKALDTISMTRSIDWHIVVYYEFFFFLTLWLSYQWCWPLTIGSKIFLNKSSRIWICVAEDNSVLGPEDDLDALNEIKCVF